MTAQHAPSVKLKVALWALFQPLLALAQQTDSQAPLPQPPGNWPGAVADPVIGDSSDRAGNDRIPRGKP